MILNGIGTGGRPTGLLLNPGAPGFPDVYLSGVNNDISADMVRQMPFQLPEQYLDNVVWVMNRRGTGAKIASFKGTDNTYLFAFGAQDARLAGRVPDSLLGYPIVYSAFMPNPGDGQFPLLFGDLRGYQLVRRMDLSIAILGEVGAFENVYWVLGRLRFGGAPLRPWTMVIGKSDNT
jgi:HK97 family phage major capsid protein